MARPDSRSRILAAATPMFARHGLNGVSVRSLASAARVNLSMISYHFGGKDGLYAEILKEQFEGVSIHRRHREKGSSSAGKVRDVHPGDDPPVQGRNPYLLRYYVTELTNPTPCFKTIVRPAVQRVLKVLRETIEKGISRGRLRKTLSPGDGTLALAGMINFYFLIAPAAERLRGWIFPGAMRSWWNHFMDILRRGIVA